LAASSEDGALPSSERPVPLRGGDIARRSGAVI
jgi:hypothetical protein